MSAIPLCKDCAFYKNSANGRHPMCGHADALFSPVDGSPTTPCADARNDRFASKFCGPAGARFERSQPILDNMQAEKAVKSLNHMQEMLRWAAEDLADAKSSPDLEHLSRERLLAAERLLPYMDEVVQLAWRQLQADQAASTPEGCAA